MSISKFESMLKTNDVYFFDAVEFETIIEHYLTISKYSLAKKAVVLGLEQHPSSIQLKLMKVEILVLEDELVQASKMLKDIEALVPYNDEVFIQKALILSKEEKHEQAIVVLHDSLKFVEDPADIWSMLGMEFLYLDDYENARLNFEKCLEVDYEDFSSLYNIVYCFDMEESHIEAIQFLNNYINKNPYCEVAWHQLGRQYSEIGMHKEALRSFDYSVLIDEEFIGGYLEKAQTLEDLNRYEEAVKNYKIALELDDPTAFIYMKIGGCYQQLNNPMTAINFYKKAVKEDASFDKAWILLTNVYFDAEDFQKALYYVKKAIEIDAENVSYWKKCASINLKLNFYEEAVTAFYTCIELGDDEMVLYTDLADVLLFLGEFDQALKILIKAKKTYTNFAEIEYRLCGLFMILDKQAYGLTHLKNALAIDYEARQLISFLYPTVYQSEKVQEIIACYKKALK
ncbi:tetratricopeptide repeat protein [Tenacibaculum piscium]|uniref:tetratricopeptide repeat protein n=1 Tax=Tenacibaculum piscium TaxID=1458515 RepID=UPI001F29068B|nr:tetratricopeptide repeat protein [Tenacibaculum piscium]